MFKKLFFLILVLVAFNSQIFSQASLKGILVDDANQAVPFSTLALYSSDTTLVKAEQSDINGVFNFINLKEGNYFINVRYVGYEAKTIIIENLSKGENRALGNVSLKTSVTQLEDVIIESQKPLIEIRPGKTIFNVASDPSNLGNDGITLLSRAPGITIDPDNNIVFQGKVGVRVFINGRPSRLSGNDLSAMLMSLQADNIESIELITNPSSKYEAEGNTGIINIQLKKNADAGLNGNFYTNASQGSFLRKNIGLSLNYRKDKVNVYGTMNYSDNDSQNEFNHVASQNEYQITLANPAKNLMKSPSLMLGTDYYISKKHFLGVLFTGNSTDFGVDAFSQSIIQTLADTIPTEVLISRSIQEFQSSNQQFNINYEFMPAESLTLTTDLNYGLYSNEGGTQQPNTYFSEDQSVVNRVVNFEDNRNTNIDIKAGKFDIEKNFKKLTFSSGIKVSLIETNNDYKFYNQVNGTAILDLNRSNNFNYKEDVYAVYMLVSSNLTPRIKYDMGIRYEHTFSEGRLISQIPNNNNKVKREYGNYFPNIGLTYTSENKYYTVALSYGKRVSRPNYQNLNPFEYKLSELQFEKGNPFLLPSFTDQIQTSYSLKQKLTGTIGYSFEKDYVAQVLQINDDKSNFLQPQNMQSINTIYTDMSIPFKFTVWWEFRSTLTYNYGTYYGEFNNTVVDIDNSVYSVTFSTNVKITDNLMLTGSFFYESESIWRGSIYIDPYYRINLGLNYYLFDKALQLRLNGNDIFNTGSDFGYLGDYGGLYIDGAWSGDISRFGGGLTWNFGNEKLKDRKRRKTAIDDEINRIE